MSTSYEAHLVVGLPLEDLYNELSEEFKEENGIEDMWDYRNDFFSDMLNDDEGANWIGVPIVKDGEVYGPERLHEFLEKVKTAMEEFKEATGHDGKITTMVWSY